MSLRVNAGLVHWAQTRSFASFVPPANVEFFFGTRSEFLVTSRTLVGFFTCVVPEMNFQLHGGGERLGAGGALVGFLTSVDDQVPAKPAGVFIGGRAEVALIRPGASVNDAMPG